MSFPLGVDNLEEGRWLIYKQTDGSLLPIYVHWSNQHEFERSRILQTNPFGTYEEAVQFIENFWNVFWGVSLL